MIILYFTTLSLQFKNYLKTKEKFVNGIFFWSQLQLVGLTVSKTQQRHSPVTYSYHCVLAMHQKSFPEFPIVRSTLQNAKKKPDERTGVEIYLHHYLNLSVHALNAKTDLFINLITNNAEPVFETIVMVIDFQKSL